jgi:hypothetical protein
VLLFELAGDECISWHIDSTRKQAKESAQSDEHGEAAGQALAERHQGETDYAGGEHHARIPLTGYAGEKEASERVSRAVD